MASSASYDFNITRDQLISLAHQHIGVLAEGGTASANQITEASLLLNMIVKLRHADGMPAWSIKRAFILPISGQQFINTDTHVVHGHGTTTIGAAEAAGQTVITVTSSSGMLAADNIGIELDNGDMHWTTIVSVDSAVQITITSALSSAAAAGNYIYWYTAGTNRIQKPIRILYANIYDVPSNIAHEIDVVTRFDYYRFTDRATEGVPHTIYYDQNPGVDTAVNTSGQIFFYPRFENGKKKIEFIYQLPFQDFDSSTDNPAFPQAFFLPLMLELAAMLGAKYGVSIEERNRLFAEAKMYREEALASAYEEGSLKIIPNFRG